MPPDKIEHSPIPAARTAGGLWLIVIIASIAVTIGRPSLDWRSDPAALVTSVAAVASRIRLAFAINLLGKLCYIGATILLYELLKPVSRSVALFGAFCGLAGIMSGTSLFNDFTNLSLLEESRRAVMPVAGRLQETAVTLGLAHSLGTSGELVFFGAQIGALGYLVLRSSFLPRTIGFLLILGGIGVVITQIVNFVVPAVGVRLAPLTLPIILLGEGSFALWLLLKGVNVEQWRLAAHRTAAKETAT